jgi:hypothetical protein
MNGILLLSLLAGLVGAAAGAAAAIWRLQGRLRRPPAPDPAPPNPMLPRDVDAARLLETVDRRLGEFARISGASCLMTSPSERLSSITGRWHQYNVTRKDGATTWIHAEYEIAATPAGALEFSVEYRDNQGGTAEYLYEGVLRDDRVVFIGRPADGEQPCFVEIWPHLANKSLKHHFGICLNQSWDQQETLIPCVMTRRRIDPFDDQTLDSLWIAHLQSSGLDVFPRLRSSLGGR